MSILLSVSSNDCTIYKQYKGSLSLVELLQQIFYTDLPYVALQELADATTITGPNFTYQYQEAQTLAFSFDIDTNEFTLCFGEAQVSMYLSNYTCTEVIPTLKARLLQGIRFVLTLYADKDARTCLFNELENSDTTGDSVYKNKALCLADSIRAYEKVIALEATADKEDYSSVF